MEKMSYLKNKKFNQIQFVIIAKKKRIKTDFNVKLADKSIFIKPVNLDKILMSSQIIIENGIANNVNNAYLQIFMI